MNTYETEKLANGLRIIYEPSATEVVYCGYVVNAGTRHEPADREGMAHFIEHMSFKGTEHRIISEGTALDNYMFSKVRSVCDLNYLK